MGGEIIRSMAGGTVVAEVRRTGTQVFVATADGVTGWVAEDRLQPAQPGPDGEGER